MTSDELELCAVAADRWPMRTSVGRWYFGCFGGMFDPFNSHVDSANMKYG